MIAPREAQHLIGHDAAEAELAAAARGPRLHHAWLIAGPRGIGKATLAYRFARFLLAGHALASPSASLAIAPTSGVFRRVAADTHADLFSVELRYDEARKRLRSEILVEDVREIGGFLRLTAAEAGWRVVLIDGAEAMNKAAANALLKLLEEPPARAILLLVSHAPGALSPTLRSRCRALRLAPLDPAAMRQVLALHAPSLPPGLADRAADLDRLLALAAGSPGRAISLAAEGGLALADLAAEVLAAPGGPRPDQIQTIADRFGRADSGFELFFELLRQMLAEAIGAAARGQPHRLAPLLATKPLAAWAELWQALGQISSVTARFHMDRRQAVADALVLLA